MAEKDLRTLRILAGVERNTHLSEAAVSRSKTAGYIQQALEMLDKAKKASRHRKLVKESPMYSALQRAQEACTRAHEACYEAGETVDVDDVVENTDKDPILTLTPEQGKPSTGPSSYFMQSWRRDGDAQKAIKMARTGKRASWDSPAGTNSIRPATAAEIKSFETED
jgi:hypothetical protein